MKNIALCESTVFRRGILGLLVAVVLGGAGLDQVRAQKSAGTLPAYDADVRETSISGISSGAFMAVQFAVAWSSIVKGVGAIAGGPYFCAQGTPGRVLSKLSILTATQDCMTAQPFGPDVEPLIEATDGFTQDGTIDDPANLARQRFYVFSGYNDSVVAPQVGATLVAWYAHYLTAEHAGNLYVQNAIGAGHSQVTADYGSSCAANGGHYINNCGYDQAGIILQHIYGALQPKNISGVPQGKLTSFSQRAFIGGGVVPPKTYGLAETGYVYVPETCATSQCRVHVALHGCLQNAESIGQEFVLHAGYNEWADTNHIIVLYPQTTATNGLLDPSLPLNPNGCWDWWGLTDSNYATKQGEQVGAIKAMLDRLTSGWRRVPTPPVVAGAVPEDVQTIDSSDTTIDIVWAPLPGVAAYDVFRKQAGNGFVRIATVNGPSFGDSGLTPATSYQYAVAVAGTASPALSVATERATMPTPPRCKQPGKCPLPH